MDEELLADKINEAKSLMGEAITHLEGELMKIRTGKASPAMLSGIMVPYYGTPTPLSQVANLGTSDARTLTIQPWEKNMLAPIEKAIFEANLGLTPMNNGESIMINVPPLTEERRKQMAKMVKDEGETAKISVRNARRDAMEAIKKEVKNGYPEDAGKRKEDEVQSATDSYSKKIDGIVDAKTEEVMTV
ncbi:ribosome recycling factor [Lewinellaceae bacterium SD302]|nr:ribosome recycling factor [Lewinellaceae bacterium SD302]